MYLLVFKVGRNINSRIPGIGEQAREHPSCRNQRRTRLLWFCFCVNPLVKFKRLNSYKSIQLCIDTSDGVKCPSTYII